MRSTLPVGVLFVMVATLGCGDEGGAGDGADTGLDAPAADARVDAVPDAGADAPAVPDAAVDAADAAVAFDATAVDPLDAAVDAVVDAGRDQPNRVFVTRTAVYGDFGGLAAADALCAAEATAVGLDGTYVAWLSTSTVDARDRLAGSAGWIRTDGAPVAATVARLVGEEMFAAADRDVDGHQVIGPVWTGTGPDGRLAPGQACDDWGSQLPDTVLGDPAAAMPYLTAAQRASCDVKARLLCFEIGHQAVVAPVPDPTATRHAFVSRAQRSGVGVAPLDLLCAGEASAAGLPGTYRAAVATSTASVASRFVDDGRAWRRVDGTRVAGPGLLGVLAGYPAFVNQHADGTYASVAIMTGAPSPTVVGTATCDDWQSYDLGAEVVDGLAASAWAASFWGATAHASCAAAQHLLCLEE